MLSKRLRKGVLVAALLVAAGCSNGDNTDTRAEDTGSVQVALVIVPADVQCVSITATGARVRQQNFNVTPGQTSVLSMAGLPVGQVTFTGEAFPGGCGGGGPTGPSPNRRQSGDHADQRDGRHLADAEHAAQRPGVDQRRLRDRRHVRPGRQRVHARLDHALLHGADVQGDPTGINSCQPQNMCAPGGAQCDATTVCCSGLVCQGDPTGINSCQPLVMCRPPGSPCGPGMTQQCCAGLTCQLDAAGLPSCAAERVRSARERVLGNGRMLLGARLSGRPTGINTCQQPAMCRPPGAPCGPGMTQQCCAGLTCQLDPAGTPICF